MEVCHKPVKIIKANTGIKGTGADTFAAADTKIAVVIYNISGPVVAHFDRTDHDAAMTIDAFVFQHTNHRS
jgi:hypothetical protein